MSVYSHSKLACFGNCPRQYKFKYVEKVEVPKRVSPDAYLGNAVHCVLRTLYTHGGDGVLVPREDALAMYRAEWEKVDRESIRLTRDYYTVDDYIRLGEQMLAEHYDRHQPFDQGTLLGTELHLTFQLADTPFRIHGYIDKLWKRDDGITEICDYKTGQRIAHPREPQFFFQMGIYQLAVQANYPQLEQIELTQFFLRQNEVVRHRMRPDEMDHLVEELRAVICKILDAERLDRFPTVEGGLCAYCDYSDICPARRHRKMLDTTSDVANAPGGSDAVRLRELADTYVAVNRRQKQVKTELEALNQDVMKAAQDHDLTVLTGTYGDVRVKLFREEKFVTKTKDARAFAELSHLARELELDDYFALDGRALMKDIYRKRRLPPEQLERLKPFVSEEDGGRVSVKLHRDDGKDNDNDNK
ncbi:MAG: PD-(D/E)XK nuclease family protein [candidate division Zixibacteria bacterium]|nr:PD-(D/E)XK nuclease family protein [candidate division Zixibacteria bacterium]